MGPSNPWPALKMSADHLSTILKQMRASCGIIPGWPCYWRRSRLKKSRLRL